jgi:predicted ATPase
MTAAPFSIRTPDQRLRVFVSSTLKELAAERKSARASIERLHLAPVMFELGARPHPPRELYRAYLAQSDVFLGLYWERYGWVAPGETVSGLEDEYNLAPDLPKLIYIKESTGAREPRLNDLLDRIREDDTASFKYFGSARELVSLVEGDLATLLAERFDQSRAAEATRVTPEDAPVASLRSEPRALPVPLNELIGREAEADALMRLISGEGGGDGRGDGREGGGDGGDGARLVTITGPGGIGKSRLAIDVATRLVDDFPDGVFFVDLSAVHDPALVPNAIADAIGIRDTGDIPLQTKLVGVLRSRRMLLVLDNFEQIVDAASTITELLMAAPRLHLLLTSRTLLRVSAERGFEVGPLALPRLTRRSSLEEVIAAPSVALFVERVHAVKPDFEVTEANYVAIGKICIALDGVPLALELAAARVRLLPPAAMLARLNRRLPLLEGGARDLPARQQTLRRTIEWSTQLLNPEEKHLLSALGIFDGGFSIDAVEAIVGGAPSGDASSDLLTVLGGLVDNSLVRQEDRGDRAYFSILATVKEYALEQLERSGELAGFRQRHADYFVALVGDAEGELLGAHQRQWVERLGFDRENLRSAVRYLLDQGRGNDAAAFAWALFIYWWIDGNRGEVVGWMQEVLDSGSRSDGAGSGGALSDRARAIALYYTCAISFWQDLDDRVVPGLTESAELFHRENDASEEALALVSLALALLVARTPDPPRAEGALERSLSLFTDSGNLWGQAMALVTIGRVELLQQRTAEALERFRRSLTLAHQVSDELGEGVALNHLGWASLFLGDVEGAQRAFSESLMLSARLGHGEGIAYGLEGFVAVAAVGGDVDRAGRLLGASESLRDLNGIFNAAGFSFHRSFVEQMSAPATAQLFQAARAAGRELSADEAVTLALSVAELA